MQKAVLEKNKKMPQINDILKYTDPPCTRGYTPWDHHWEHKYTKDGRHKGCKLVGPVGCEELIKTRNILAHEFGYGTEAYMMLQDRAKMVNMQKVGCDSTYCPEFMTKDKYVWCKRFGVGQALTDNISNSEAGLSIRWMLPTDFSDAYGDMIKSRDWRWPKNKWYEVFWITDPYDKKKIQYIAKQDIAKTEYYGLCDRRIYVFIGLKIEKPTYATALDFCRGDVKTIQVIGLSNLKPGQAFGFDLPILYKRVDICKIRASLSEDAQGHRDKIIFYGFVVEALGATQTG